MLKSYKATLEHGQLKWLAESPNTEFARIIVTILEEYPTERKRRSPPASIAGKSRYLGDPVEPIVSEEEWECLR